MSFSSSISSSSSSSSTITGASQGNDSKMDNSVGGGEIPYHVEVVARMSATFAQFMWNPLCKALIKQMAETPHLVRVISWCLANFVPVLEKLQPHNIDSIMRDFITSTRKYQHLLLERNIEFLKQKDNKFVHCLCLPAVFANPATSEQLKNDIWQHLLGLQLVASTLWEIPTNLWVMVDKLIPQQMSGRNPDGTFKIPDVTPIINQSIEIMSRGELKFDEVLKAIEHSKYMLNGGRTPGEVGPFSRLITMMPKEPPYDLLHTLHGIFRTFAELSSEELEPILAFIGDKFNLDGTELNDEEMKDPKRMMKFFEEKVNTPQIKNLVSDMVGQDPRNMSGVLQKHLGFGSLDEILRHSKKPQKSKQPDDYDLMFQDNENNEATVRSVPG